MKTYWVPTRLKLGAVLVSLAAVTATGCKSTTSVPPEAAAASKTGPLSPEAEEKKRQAEAGVYARTHPEEFKGAPASAPK